MKEIHNCMLVLSKALRFIPQVQVNSHVTNAGHGGRCLKELTALNNLSDNFLLTYQKNWKCTTVEGLALEGDDFSKTDFLKSSSVSILSDLNKSSIFGEFLLLIPVDNEDL